MNKVLLTGRLTRDPELRALASGSNVTTFAVASERQCHQTVGASAGISNETRQGQSASPRGQVAAEAVHGRSGGGRVFPREQ